MASVAKSRAASKPVDLFTRHCRGYWVKRIRGTLQYFGRIDSDPKAHRAAEQWARDKDDLLAGRTPRVKSAGLTVEDAADNLVNHKKPYVARGELSQRSYDEYKAAGKLLINCFGAGRLVSDLGPEDFDELRETLSKKWGLARLSKTIQLIKTIFKFALDTEAIERPVRYGPSFKRPSAAVMRKHREAQGERMLEAEQIRALLDIARPQFRAMLLLAANCGYGNNDCATLPIDTVDLDGGWINYARPKTGVRRRCPLWRETIDALRAALEKRPTPKNSADAGLVFITKRRQSWAKESSDNPVSKQFAKLADELGIRRKGVGFYSLRRAFETIGGACRDQVAVDSIMGHVDSSMGAVYRQRIDDERLRVVVNHVHNWLYGKQGCDFASGKL